MFPPFLVPLVALYMLSGHAIIEHQELPLQGKDRVTGSWPCISECAGLLSLSSLHLLQKKLILFHQSNESTASVHNAENPRLSHTSLTYPKTPPTTMIISKPLQTSPMQWFEISLYFRRQTDRQCYMTTITHPSLSTKTSMSGSTQLARATISRHFKLQQALGLWIPAHATQQYPWRPCPANSLSLSCSRHRRLLALCLRPFIDKDRAHDWDQCSYCSLPANQHLQGYSRLCLALPSTQCQVWICLCLHLHL